MPYQMWINGKHTSGSSGQVIEVRNPATEEVIDTAPAANAADVNAAVSAAQAYNRLWHRTPPWSQGCFLTCLIPHGVLC